MVVIRPMRDENDLEQVSRLTAVAFGGERADELYELLKKAYLGCPYLRWDLCIVAELNGRIVSKAQIIEYEMSVGTAQVRMGGIMGVATDPEHRGKGYASRVLRRCVEVMAENGFDLSILFGIEGFYERFGYAPVMPDYELILQAGSIDKRTWKGFREMKGEGDLDEMFRIYHASNRGRTGIILRRKGIWEWLPHKPDLILFHGEGKPDGYVAVSFGREALELVEVGGEDVRFYEMAIAELGELARSSGLDEIRGSVPPDHPFSLASIKYGAEVRVRYRKSGGCMGRIIDQRRLLEKIAPELERRLIASGCGGMGVALRIETELGRTELELVSDSPGKVEVNLSLPQKALMQMVFGYKPVEVILAENGIPAGRREVEALNALFPWGYPFIWKMDRF
mgnify:CR=1 FL=1